MHADAILSRKYRSLYSRAQRPYQPDTQHLYPTRYPTVVTEKPPQALQQLPLAAIASCYSQGAIANIGNRHHGTCYCGGASWIGCWRLNARCCTEYVDGIRPTWAPTPFPTRFPTKSPTLPTHSPTTREPTLFPTFDPTKWPTESPTKSPTTSSPTRSPTSSPTLSPTRFPTRFPTRRPTWPTPHPTRWPTGFPSVSPTLDPT